MGRKEACPGSDDRGSIEKDCLFPALPQQVSIYL